MIGSVHQTDNRMFYQMPPAELTEARKSSHWKQFHRECGRHGLFFDDINRGARNQWSAIAFTFRADTRVVVARGSGATPVTAVQATFDAARAAGHPIPHLSVVQGDGDIDDMIG